VRQSVRLRARNEKSGDMPESLDLQPPTDLTLQRDKAHNAILQWRSPAQGDIHDRTEIWGAPRDAAAGAWLLGVVTHVPFTPLDSVRTFAHLRQETSPWVYRLWTVAATGERSAFVEIEG
jgi:hypothetical protein